MERNCILPDDLVEDILSRLPAKDLLRFRCVSKGWCALIDDATFINKHYQVQYSFRKLDDNMTYFVPKSPGLSEIYLVSIQQGEGEGNNFRVNLTDDLKRDDGQAKRYGSVSCYGCVNGIVCLSYYDSFLALWNPATREFNTVACPNLFYYDRFEIVGFGFDLSSSDFKILGWCSIQKEHGFFIDFRVIYSLKSNSWKQINNFPDDGVLPMASSNGYLNGVHYWAYKDIDFPVRSVILSFNFASEAFKLSDLPPDALSLVAESYPSQSQMYIALYKERLALVIIHKVSEETLCIVRVWVATELDNCGVPVSWQHLFTITPPCHPRRIIMGSTILMNGDLLLSFLFPDNSPTPIQENANATDDGEVYLYNHSKGEFKKLDIFMWDVCYSFRYVESLFPLSRRLVQAA